MSNFNLFIYKIFSSSDLIQFHLYLIFKKIYFHLLYQKNLLQNFNLTTKIIFTCFYKKMNEFLQFYLHEYFNLFSFKKSDLYKLFIKKNIHHFICKTIFN